MASLEHLLAAGNGDFPTAPDHPKELVELPVVLDPKNLAHPGAPLVSPLLWSGFIEHLGRCIYGGIVDDYRNPSPAELLIQQGKGRPAWRSDILKLLASDGDLQVPMIRWPGGNFVSNYHWQDGIGPIESRPKRTELAWLDMEPNTSVMYHITRPDQALYGAELGIALGQTNTSTGVEWQRWNPISVSIVGDAS